MHVDAYSWLLDLSLRLQNGRLGGLCTSRRRYFKCHSSLIHVFNVLILTSFLDQRLCWKVLWIQLCLSVPPYVCSAVFPGLTCHYHLIFFWSSDVVVKTLDALCSSPRSKTAGWLQGLLSFSSFCGQLDEYQEELSAFEELSGKK